MDIFIRIIIMLLMGIAIPFIANLIYSPLGKKFENLKEENIITKIFIFLFYIFCANWFIITPCIIFFDCFKYIFIK